MDEIDSHFFAIQYLVDQAKSDPEKIGMAIVNGYFLGKGKMTIDEALVPIDVKKKPNLKIVT